MTDTDETSDVVDGFEDRREILEESDFDTELGLEMARDAIAVSEGDLSEEEFHDRYHDDVMAEFGVDERPTAAAAADDGRDGAMSRVLQSFAGDGEQSRREAMTKMGAGAAFLGIGAWGTTGDDEGDDDPEAHVAAADSAHGDDEGLQWGKVIDLERCDACLSCVVACAEENQTDPGVNWMYVLQYEDGEADTSLNRLVRSCQHCTDAPCEKVCPTTARHTRDKDGLVLTDYDVCIGCRYCQVACPYGLNYFQWDDPEVSQDELVALHEGHEGDHQHDDRDRWVASRAPAGVMSKCTFNVHRQDGHKGEGKVGTTACQEACPPGAIQFGNRNDPNSDPQQYLENPSKGRTLNMISPPSAETVADEIADADADVASVLEASALNAETLRVMKALEIVSDGVAEPEVGNSDLAGREQAILDVLEAIEAHGVDLDGEEALVELGLAEPTGEDESFDGPSEADAQQVLEAFAGAPASNFKLREDVGTNPNTTFLGNEPGPNAEQVPGPVAYEDIGRVDNRKDSLDEGTVGDVGVSL